MLSYEQKLYLVKNIDKYALSSMRKEKLPSFFKKFRGHYTESDYKHISDLLYLSETNVKNAEKEAKNKF
jgi:hypothetical protein